MSEKAEALVREFVLREYGQSAAKSVEAQWDSYKAQVMTMMAYMRSWEDARTTLDVMMGAGWHKHEGLLRDAFYIMSNR